MLIYICYKEYRYVYVFQFSNIAKYGHGPPEDGFKGDRNMYGRILSVFSVRF